MQTDDLNTWTASVKEYDVLIEVYNNIVGVQSYDAEVVFNTPRFALKGDKDSDGLFCGYANILRMARRGSKRQSWTFHKDMAGEKHPDRIYH